VKRGGYLSVGLGCVLMVGASLEPQDERSNHKHRASCFSRLSLPLSIATEAQVDRLQNQRIIYYMVTYVYIHLIPI